MRLSGLLCLYKAATGGRAVSGAIGDRGFVGRKVAVPDRRQREVYYAGNVQGVGFRYTARCAAAGLDVTGFVRNLPDGRVHLVVEGPPRDRRPAGCGEGRNGVLYSGDKRDRARGDRPLPIV